MSKASQRAGDGRKSRRTVLTNGTNGIVGLASVAQQRGLSTMKKPKAFNAIPESTGPQRLSLLAELHRLAKLTDQVGDRRTLVTVASPRTRRAR